MIVKHGFKSLVKDAVMINYLSLYLCRYGLRGKEVVGVALVELKSLLVNMRNQNIYVLELYHCEQLGSMVLNAYWLLIP